MKILVAGAGGQLGRALGEALVRHSVIALDHGKLDVTGLEGVRAAVRDHRPDLVINAAAFTHVDDAETRAETAYVVNARGPRNCAVATAEQRIPVLQVSTDYVFDGTGSRPYHEFDRPNPTSVYGASKLAGELEVREINPRHYVVRTAWLYHLSGRNFLNAIRGLAERPEVRVVSDQYGSPTYAPHLAQAVAELIDTGAYGTYHLAGRGEASWFEVARSLYECLGIRTPVVPVPTAAFPRPARRPRYSVLTTLQDPEISLPPWQEGLAAYVAALARSP
jgi:dTDP-4-dehydrorhamnose reductase